jgi:hypothetical protein
MDQGNLDMADSHPSLNERARGWLHFLWQKSTTADDWSEGGEPHPWWDRYSTAPMMNFPRFDLSESSYAVGVMADRTPAWREVYGTILEGFVERHLTYWAAIDWLSHIGPDPRRGDYPQEWIDALIPSHLVGNYDVPGWCANGVEPWGLQPDPIGAEGNLFFKGWLNLTMSLHAYVSGEDRWTRPFEVAGLDGARFDWTQHGLTERLVDQWTRHPEGPHCENTKIWPFCLSAAGLGLQLYDAVFDRDTHHVFDAWLDHTRGDYFGFDRTGALEWTTLYYDPLVGHNQTLGPAGGLGTCLYLMPQDPALAEVLYRAAVAKLGWDDPSKSVRAMPDPRFTALGLALAKEWGDETTFGRLADHAEANFEPRRFGPTNDAFGWWFNFGEDWPRGQLSALMAMAEVGGPGAWSRLFTAPDLAKFDLPTVTGVDFPSLGIARAWNDSDAGILHITTYAGDSAKAGQPSRFQVTRLPDSGRVTVRCDGAETANWQPVDAGTIEITTDIAAHEFQIRTGAVEGPKKRRSRSARSAPLGGRHAFDAATISVKTTALSQGVALSAGPGCPCCAGL